MSCASACRSREEIEEGKPLRFQLGDSVICKIDPTTWADGEIVQPWWQHPGNSMFYPYRVKLQFNQKLIIVPKDSEEIIRKIERAWWETLKGQDDLSDDEVVEAIERLGAGKDPNAQSFEGQTALMWALKRNLHGPVNALLRLKADPNCAGQNSERALNIVISRYSGAALTSFTQALLAARADPSLQDKDPNRDPACGSRSFKEREWHRSALHYAAEQGNVDVMRLLLDARAEPNLQDGQYKIPLHLAIESENLDAVHLLINSKADMNVGHIAVGMATTPLIDAVYRNDQPLVHLLISAKADLNHKGKQDMTALHVAARGRRKDIAAKLVEAGADTTLTAGGKTAGDLAFKNGLADLATLLGYAGESSGSRIQSASQLLDAQTRAMLFIDEPPAKQQRPS
eukprot:TRINITY_DN66383_c0_g1_i1.p1 TRINITY_DN66383_c0_g1~~TRINITY_DN66383_c0_g1_i1.p1  ORF type:complete len:400 (-),score=56.26 TRINITY_DN66383_c0_g1_i1:23-1222(-)